MNKPTDIEVNTRLAEFMGYEVVFVGESCIAVKGKVLAYKYTESLDAQIPIMEKLSGRKGIALYEFLIGKPEHLCKYLFEPFVNTIQQATAYALYYAIMESEK